MDIDDKAKRVLNLHTDKISNGAALSYPFPGTYKDKNYMCASDGISIILIPGEINPPDTNYPKCVSNIMLDKNTNYEMSITKLKKFINRELKHYIEEKEDCDECDGEGSFMHGHYEYECKNCDGTGCIKSSKKYDVDPDSIIKFVFPDSKIPIRCVYINRLITTCEILNICTINIVSIIDGRTMMFELGRGIMYVMMGVINISPNDFVKELFVK